MTSATNKYEENYEQKCLCVLVLDTSGSMEWDSSCRPIDELNKGLKRFQSELLLDKTTRDRLEVSIVSFNSEIRQEQDPALLTDFEMPTLSTDGSTKMIDGISEAIDIVNERKQYYKSHGIPYYRPWIVLMTDGYPDDDQDVEGMSTRIKAAHDNKEFIFMAVGIGDSISEDALTKLSVSNFPPMKMQAVKFAEFFVWLSNSMGAVSHSKPGEEVILPNPESWLDDMIK